jgi:hypothetical protein
MNNTIESLQRWLKAKGFDPGPIDGMDGPLTFAGWSAYLAATDNTLESLQRWLKAKGFDPGPIDGMDGPLTFAGWSAYQAAAGAPDANNGAPSSQDLFNKLLARAKADVGVLSTSDDPGTDHGQLGCADAVTRILHDELGFSLPKTLSTDELFDELVHAGWKKVDLLTTGAVIVSPSCAAMHGHTGIVGENGAIYSNSSATGRWTQNWTVDGWVRYYARCGSFAFAPPSTAVLAPQTAQPAQPAAGNGSEQKPIGFAPLGLQAPVRGQFSIGSSQVAALCAGHPFAAYHLYAAAIVEDSAKYGINPLFVLADIVNQGVNPAYRNPWGISTDNYPYGPGGKQLGQPNGRIKNGPRSFSEDEWRIAFDRQFSVVATGRAYANANTVAEWARIDAPPGAENDPHGTNAQEAKDVGNLYNQLVGMLG